MPRLLLLLLLAVPALADDAVDWTDAASCVGRVCSLRGTVVAQEDGGPYYRLYFDQTRRDVYVTLMRGWLVTWPSYVGHPIVATGPVDRFRDHSEMILLTPDAITFLDAPDTPTVGAAATPTAASPTAAPATAMPATEVPATAVPPPPVIPPPAGPAPATPSSEVEELRERVRSLERKIEQLESGRPETP